MKKQVFLHLYILYTVFRVSAQCTCSVVPNYGIVECCLFEFTAGIGNQFYTGGIDGHHCKNWIVRNNIFKHIRSPDNNLAEHAIHFWSESQGTLTENNLIINCDRGIGFGLGNDNTRRHIGGIIRNNMIHTSRDAGISLEKSSNTKVYNNTLHTLNYSNSIEYRFDSTYNAHIANNLSNGNITAREGGTGILENNYKYPDTSVFINAQTFNYHLKPSNPNIIDKGKTLAAVTGDYDCQTRPAGNGYDIGSDEYVAVVSVVQNEPVPVPVFFAYPNPADEKTSITGTDAILHITICDLPGKQLFTIKKEGNNYNINTSRMPSGIYIATIHTAAGIIPIKISVWH